MKTTEEWLRWFSNNPPHCDPACSCDRCKKGQETFLLSSDIKAIQLDAYKAGMTEAAKRVSNLPNHYVEYAKNAIHNARDNTTTL